MPGIKRKSLEEDGVKIKESKKVKAEKDVVSKADKKFANKLAKKDKKSDMSVKEERKEKSNGFKKSKKEPTPEESSIEEEDFGNEDQMVVDQEDDEMDNTENVKPVKQAKGDAGKISEAPAVLKGSTDGANVTKSREAHQKQKEEKRERKAAKPNADAIQRAKKLWEKLRVKSKVEKAERAKLVAELFDLVTGNVKEFVFKHDSVRPIQSALKYGSLEQRKMIAVELQGSYKELIEGKYSRHLVAKLLEGDEKDIRDMIIPEFYGSVKRLMNQPEASWMLDDIYRVKASKQQKALMLREWYGTEFALEKGKNKDATADLAQILKDRPEHRKPILEYLHQIINQLIQKKLTGFTMLHDALLQYFKALEPGSTDFNDCMRLVIGDKNEEESDLLKNLAFTASGAELVCLVLAYGTAKDRKLILRAYKDAIELIARDQYGWQVLVTAYEVVDDTRETLSRIFSELVSYGNTEEKQALQQEKILGLSTQLCGRMSLLFPFVGPEKWLLPKQEQQDFVERIHELRQTTSKKNPDTRRLELVTPLSPLYIATIAENASVLLKDSYGTQFISAVLLSGVGDKSSAVEAITQHVGGDPNAEEHPAALPHTGRLLKSLVSGGSFDPKQKKVVVTAPDLKFADALYEQIEEHVIEWATGSSSFVVVAMMEAGDFEKREELAKKLRKGKKALEKAAEGKEKKNGRLEDSEDKTNLGKKSKKSKKAAEKAAEVRGSGKGNAGSRLLLDLLDT